MAVFRVSFSDFRFREAQRAVTRAVRPEKGGRGLGPSEFSTPPPSTCPTSFDSFLAKLADQMPGEREERGQSWTLGHRAAVRELVDAYPAGPEATPKQR